jgi:CHASE2 domain-containing sensor protein
VRDVHTRDLDRTAPKPWRTLLWIAIAGLIFGALGLGEIGEDVLRTGRNSLHWHKASGDIVVVKMDDASNRFVGRVPPWPRRYYAKLTDELTRAGAKRIFFDVKFYGATDPVDDRMFTESLTRSGRVTLAVRGPSRTNFEGESEELPLPAFASHAHLGSINWFYNYQNAVWPRRAANAFLHGRLFRRSAVHPIRFRRSGARLQVPCRGGARQGRDRGHDH